MVKIYYKHEMGGVVPAQPADEANLRIVVRHPFMDTFHTFVWRAATFFLCGTYCEWQLYRNAKLVSTAEVISWIPIFRFMPCDGIHIGPCRTVPDERGKGYYPYLLRKIVESTEKDCYMIVNETNQSSIRGVLKAGFVEIGRGYKNSKGLYVMHRH